MFEQAFKNIDADLRNEAGCTTELDYTEQTSWLLFLKYLDGLEQDKATEAVLEGEIARVQKGSGGFGYDSVFLVPGRGATLAELKEAGAEVKTHRILALEELCRRLKSAPPV